MGSTSTYHSLLRISSVVVALLLVFESGLLSSSTSKLANQTTNYLASAVSADLPTRTNSVSTISNADIETTAVLTNDDQSQAQAHATTNLDFTFILIMILFILLTLMIIDYVFYYARRSTKTLPASSVETK